MKEESSIDKIYKYIAMAILVALIFIIPVNIVLRRNSMETYGSLVKEFGANSEQVSEFVENGLYSIPDGIYAINKFLCVVSIIVQICYFTRKKMIVENAKSFESFLGKYAGFVGIEIALLIIDCVVMSLGYRILLEIVMLLTILLSLMMFLYFKMRNSRKEI